MPPLETETVAESFERVRFESHVSQELRGLCAMIKRLMSARLRSREFRDAAAAAAFPAPEPRAPAEPGGPGAPAEGQGRGRARAGGERRPRRYNLRLIGVPEAEDHANDAHALVQALLRENFPELLPQEGAAAAGLPLERAQRVPARFSDKRGTPRHILVTFRRLGDKERVVQLARQRKEVTYAGLGVRLASDFSPAVLKARRQWSGVYRALQERGLEPRILYPARLAFVHDGERTIVPDVRALRKLAARAPRLAELLEGVLLPLENES